MKELQRKIDIPKSEIYQRVWTSPHIASRNSGRTRERVDLPIERVVKHKQGVTLPDEQLANDCTQFVISEYHISSILKYISESN